MSDNLGERDTRAARESERGAVAVEFALVLPLLLLIIFAIIEFSTAFNRYNGLHAAAREGARIAALPQSTRADITARVDDALQGVALSTSPTISITPSSNQPCNGRPGQSVTVTVTADAEIDLLFFGSRDVTMTGRGVFRCE